MKKFLLFLLVTLQLLVLISYVHSQKPPAQPALMWYVLSWPPTFCMNLKTGKCIVPIREDIFTLHGLWPADANGKTISCPTKPDPDWDKLFLPIEAKLEKFWLELKADQRKRSLWKHEWQKHGVCIGEDKSKEYFNSAISTNDKFGLGNLYNYLKTSGITPSDSKTYTKEDIIKAVQKVFSPAAFNIYLRCAEIDKQKAYLNEVVLCTTLDGSSFISCPSRATNCDGFNKIVLPTPKPVALPLSLPPPTPESQEETYGTYHFTNDEL